MWGIRTVQYKCRSIEYMYPSLIALPIACILIDHILFKFTHNPGVQVHKPLPLIFPSIHDLYTLHTSVLIGYFVSLYPGLIILLRYQNRELVGREWGRGDDRSPLDLVVYIWGGVVNILISSNRECWADCWCTMGLEFLKRQRLFSRACLVHISCCHHGYVQQLICTCV